MPNGWFALLSSPELPRGRARCVEAFSRRIEIVRSASGAVEARDLARDAQEPWPIHETGGLIFVHYDRSGRAPPPPPKLDEYLTRRWTRVFTDESDYRGHPIDVVENVSDAAHFVEIHGAKAPATLRFEPAGAEARLEARFPLATPVPGFPARLDIEMIGPALMLMKTWLLFDAMVMTTTYPIRAGLTRYRISVRAKKPRWLPLLPLLAAWVVFAKSRADTMKERAIWDRRQYLAAPRLSSVDRFVMPLRAWYAQFLTSP